METAIVKNEGFAPRKSLFREYFLYRIKTNRGKLIASCVFNLLGLPVILTGVNAFIIRMGQRIASENQNEVSYNSYTFVFLALVAGILFIVAQAALAVIYPALSQKFYTKRSFADTVGCLPLSYKERFLGDFLSGLLVTEAPFLPCAIYCVASAAFAQNESKVVITKLPEYTTAACVTIFLAYLAAYSIGFFISSSCGKTSTAVLYTVITIIIIPAIIMTYGGVVYFSSVGFEPYSEILTAVSAVPPLGLVSEFYFSRPRSRGGEFFLECPTYFAVTDIVRLIVILLIIAAFIALAYFVGKYRKAERVGRDFVFEPSYKVISIVLAFAIIGVFIFVQRGDIAGIALKHEAIGFMIAFVLFLALELMHTRSFKRLVFAVIKYIVVLLAALGFCLAAKATQGFGVSASLPDKNDVESVMILTTGNMHGCHQYDNRESIAEIIEANRALLADGNELIDGSDILITYNLKNGGEVMRRYGVKRSAPSGEKKALYEFEARVRPLSMSEDFVIFSDSNYSSLQFVVRLYDVDSGIDRVCYIADEKSEEFKELLAKDLDEVRGENIHLGVVYVNYQRDGKDRSESYSIYDSCERVTRFMENKENFKENAELMFESYTVNYTDETGVHIILTADNDADAKRELISLFKINTGSGDVSEKFNIYSEKPRMESFVVMREDEKRAKELLFEIFGKEWQ